MSLGKGFFMGKQIGYIQMGMDKLLKDCLEGKGEKKQYCYSSVQIEAQDKLRTYLF